MNCGAETLPRYEERSAASSYLPEAFATDPDRLARRYNGLTLSLFPAEPPPERENRVKTTPYLLG